MLELVREHTDMQVAFLGEVDGGDLVLRGVCARSAGSLEPDQGQRIPLEDTYCKRLMDGRLTPFVPDALANPVVATLPGTAAGIRSYIGSPVVLGDGTSYGTLCAFSSAPNPPLADRDVRLLHLVARMVGQWLESEVRQRRDQDAARERVSSALAAGDPTMVFQPIVDLREDRTVGYEALARFRTGPLRGPEAWFADATVGGLALDLELRAAEQALAVIADLDDDTYLSINVSPTVLRSGELLDLLQEVPPDRIVLELTEHEAVDDLRRTRTAMKRLRRSHVSIALDDVGAGYAGLTQIVRLSPDIVKLDRALIHGVAVDVVRQSLITAAVSFAASTGTQLIAEGVEDEVELQTLRRLGVRLAQGFHLGRPEPVGQPRIPGDVS
jgi:EAL domain-containing protein (putative c-di-GMP-specific phosphodiesterase class I)